MHRQDPLAAVAGQERRHPALTGRPDGIHRPAADDQGRPAGAMEDMGHDESNHAVGDEADA